MPFRSHTARAPLTPIFRLAGRALSLHESYKNTVLNVQPANLIGFWPMDETTGTTADNAEGTAARDGTYTGVTLNSTTGPFGGASGLWDGSSDYCDIYSASLASAFNGAEGTVMAWAKVSGSGVWTDLTDRYFSVVQVDGNNFVRIFRRGALNNQVRFSYAAGGTFKSVDTTALGGVTRWFQLAITWSATADEMKVYIDGSQEGSTQTALGTWAGSLSSTQTMVGALSTTPASVWDGYLAYAAVWDTPLSAAQILALYNGGPV